MADFNELLSTLRNPGDEGAPETIYDDLSAAYNDRISSADAKISQESEARAAAEAELQRVRAHNYELLLGNPATVTNGVRQEQDTPEEPVISLDDIISYG